MKITSAIILNIYVVPLIAVLLSFSGIAQGGTGIEILDITIYLINFVLVYALAYFFNNYFHNQIASIISISIYLLIIFSLSYLIHEILVIIILPVFTHLLFFTNKTSSQINLDEPLLKLLFKELPKFNMNIIYGFIFITYVLGIIS